MASLTHPHFHFDSSTYHNKASTSTDPVDYDDAASEWTLDHEAHDFGHPLERMHNWDEDDEELYDDDAQSWLSAQDDVLSRLQDQRWLEAQRDLEDELNDTTPPAAYQGYPTQPVASSSKSTVSATVHFKKVKMESAELEIIHYLNSDAMRSDPWNHSVPTLEIVEQDGEAYLMILRLHPYNTPAFQNASDCIDFARQLLEGLTFFHENKITRVNFSPHNIGMDVGLAPISSAKWDRSEFPVRYYLASLSNAIHYDGRHTHDDHIVNYLRKDIKSLGSTLRNIFGETRQLQFLSPLLNSMTASNAATRPTAHEALSILNTLCGSLAPQQKFEALSR
ncbi:hypothetical protein FRC03_002730 [Tulasnella sp. 419]|nr:hypothetical protein FRC03_002730 [Tulasnella sp. 419]